VPASPALGRGMSERPTSGNGANGKGTTLTAKEFKSDQEVRWCPGCGDYAILASVQAFMPELGFPREKIVFVSGIGCAARFPYYMQTYGPVWRRLGRTCRCGSWAATATCSRSAATT